MRKEERKIVPTEELERVQFYVQTTSDKVHAQRLRMLKDLAAEVLAYRKTSARGVSLQAACNALVQHLLLENEKHPGKVRTGFTIHALATLPFMDAPKLLYRVSLELADDDA